MIVTNPAQLGLPDKSWPKENHKHEKWQDWDTTPWPLDDDLAYKEMSNTGLMDAKPPPNWKRLPTSEKIYPGVPFPAPKKGFTGFHKNDYQSSIRDHAVDEATGKNGEPLLVTNGFAECNWKMRCYEVNTKIHAQWIIATNQGRIRRKSQMVELQSKLSQVSNKAADSLTQKAGGSGTDGAENAERESLQSRENQEAAEAAQTASPLRSDSPTILDGMVEYIPAGDESQMNIREPGNYSSRGTQANVASSGYTTEDDDSTLSMPSSTGSGAGSRSQSRDRSRSRRRENDPDGPHQTRSAET